MNTLKILLAMSLVALTCTVGAFVHTRDALGQAQAALEAAEEGAQAGAAFMACLQSGAIVIMDGKGDQYYIECHTGKVSGT